MDSLSDRRDLLRVAKEKIPKDEVSDLHDPDWEFYAYMSLSDEETKRRSIYGDAILEIIDECLVFISPFQIEHVGGWDPEDDFCCTISGIARGVEPEITAAYNIPKDIRKMHNKTRENFTTRVSMNCSLLIRDAYERVRQSEKT